MGEKIFNDYIQIILLIDDEPEDLLDKIFTIEQEMFSVFKKIKFDLRLKTASPDSDLYLIKKSLFTHYDREESKNNFSN